MDTKKLISESEQSKMAYLSMLESIIALIPGHIYWVDKDNVYLGCNDMQAKSAGLRSRKEIVGKRNKDLPWNFNAGTLPEALDKVNKEVMKTRKAKTLEEPAVLPDGTSAVFLSSKLPLLKDDGKVLGMVGISIDITELKNTQMALQEQIKKTEAAHRSQLRFISAASHETRGPVSNAITMLEFLTEELDGLRQHLAGDKKAQSFLEKIDFYLSNVDEQSWRALNCLKNLSNLYYLQHTKLESRLSETSISAAIEKSIAQAEKEYEARKDVKIAIKMDPKLPDNILFDAMNLSEALKIIVGNAIRFSPEDGVVTVGVKTDKTPGQLCVSVSDNGAGMSKAELATIFKNIVEIDDSENSAYYKPALQLPQAKIYIESAGGSLEIKSLEDKGTTVTLKIPYELSFSTKNKQKVDQIIRSVMDGREQYILLVEDDLISQMAIKKHVTALGHRIDVASTGGEALRLAVQNHYDLFLLDITLPDMTGVELMPHLIEHYGDKVLAIAITSHASEYDEDYFIDKGIPVTLAKPVSKERLAKALKDAFIVKKYMDEND